MMVWWNKINNYRPDVRTQITENTGGPDTRRLRRTE